MFFQGAIFSPLKFAPRDLGPIAPPGNDRRHSDFPKVFFFVDSPHLVVSCVVPILSNYFGFLRDSLIKRFSDRISHLPPAVPRVHRVGFSCLVPSLFLPPLQLFNQCGAVSLPCSFTTQLQIRRLSFSAALAAFRGLDPLSSVFELPSLGDFFRFRAPHIAGFFELSFFLQSGLFRPCLVLFFLISQGESDHFSPLVFGPAKSLMCPLLLYFDEAPPLNSFER